MKINKFKSVAGAFCALAMVSCSLFPAFGSLIANAGMSKKVLSNQDNFLKEGQISNVDYEVGDGSIIVGEDPSDATKKVAKFTSTSTQDTKLFTRAWPIVSVMEDGIPVLDVDLEFTVNSIVEQTKGTIGIGFAIGVQRLAQGVASKNSAYLWVKANANEDKRHHLDKPHDLMDDAK